MLTTQQIGLAKQAGLFIFESVLYFFTEFQWCVEREPCPQTKLVISTSRTAVVRELHFVSYGKCHTVPYHQAETTHPECVRSSKVLLHRQFLPSPPASHLVVPTVSLVSGPPRGQSDTLFHCPRRWLAFRLATLKTLPSVLPRQYWPLQGVHYTDRLTA